MLHFNSSNLQCHAVLNSNVMPHLAFLHTAPSNEALFASIVADLAPQIPIAHRNNEALLAEAMTAGGVTEALSKKLQGEIEALRDQGAALIVCTCSTLGEAAEAVGQVLTVPVMRIDRPMAEAAVRAGPNILVAACVKSTIAPTTDLLRQVAKEASRRASIETLLIEEAWAFFEDGDLERYAHCIAQHVQKHGAHHNVVVLAQASMAAAADLCNGLQVPLLSSPILGVRAALARIDALVDQSP